MAAIAVGILGALLVRRVPPPAPRVVLGLRIAGVAGIVLILFAGRAVWHAVRDGYLLVLTLSALACVLAAHWHEATGARPAAARWPGLRWLRSFGRLSYEIYLTHMFCVFAVVALARASGSDGATGWLWYPVALAACWLLGALVARGFSIPCERRLRRGAAAHRAAPVAATATADV
jgi:peptidoglycan/LPS O-acetylase OafA/YrhL